VNSSHNTVAAGKPILIAAGSALRVNPLFAPFCKQTSILSSDGAVYPIQYLRDTASIHSVILESAIPSTAFTHTGEFRSLKGISGSIVKVPLIKLHLQTDFLDQEVLVGVINKLPDGVDFLLANDLWFLANPVLETSDVNAVVTCSAADRPISARVPLVAKPLRRRRRRRNRVELTPSRAVFVRVPHLNDTPAVLKSSHSAGESRLDSASVLSTNTVS